jgi:hypothetical protein
MDRVWTEIETFQWILEQSLFLSEDKWRSRMKVSKRGTATSRLEEGYRYGESIA